MAATFSPQLAQLELADGRERQAGVELWDRRFGSFHSRRTCEDMSWAIGLVIRPYVGL